MLELANWGVQDPKDLLWVTPPPTGALSQAVEVLQQLGALMSGKITARGKEMLRLPTHPRIAHMLLEASAFDIVEGRTSGNSSYLGLATDIAAILEERDPLPREAGADLSLRAEVLRRWRQRERVSAERHALERIERLAMSWRKIFNLTREDTLPIDADVGKLVAEAYPERIARQMERHSNRYKLVSGRVARLPDHDQLIRNTWLAIAHLDSGSGEGKIFLAAPLAEQDLELRAEEKEVVVWDPNRGIVASTERRVGNVVLTSRPALPTSQDVRIEILIKAFQTQGFSLLSWKDDHTAWQARIMSLRKWNQGEPWPDVSDDHLIQTAAEWLSPFIADVYKPADFQRLDVNHLLAGLLPWELQQKLNRLAPEKLAVPSSSMIKIDYSITGETPIMQVRLQEMFGLLETPTVNEGKTRVMLHLLSPGYKPVQVTQDLKSFWQTTYHEVRKELRTRYPKHSWPEDPWTAEAVRGVRRVKREQ